MDNYKSAFYVLLFVFMVTVGYGCFALLKINITLTNIHKTMQNDQITKYVDAGWMPPINFRKNKTPKPKKPKED